MEYSTTITVATGALLRWDADPRSRALTSTVLNAVDQLERLTLTAVPRPPDELTKRRLNLDADPGCQHCERYGRWSPPTTETPTDVAGNLASPLLLCRWCSDVVRRHGALPSAKHHLAWSTGDQATVRRINSHLSRSA